MRLCLATEKHQAVFTRWNAASRIEKRICRPIVNGKRVKPDDQVVTLTFFHKDVSTEPMGRFIYPSLVTLAD